MASLVAGLKAKSPRAISRAQRGLCVSVALLLCLTPIVRAHSHTPPQTAQEQRDAPARPDPASAPPPLPAEEIIRRFAAKETEFKAARENYTYIQLVRVQEFDTLGNPGGEFRRTSEIIFTPEGRRYERITREPPTTLRMVSLSHEDIQDLENIQPFVLTTEDLPKYNLAYQGREHVDEIGTYVFRVAPRRIEKGQRYFQGTIWVDDQDLQIVKTYGKAVPDIRRGEQENLFPRFETYRENIDGKYWFPTYTRADDVLRFSNRDVRIRMIVRYSDYKQFKVSTKIIGANPVEPEKPRPPR